MPMVEFDLTFPGWPAAVIDVAALRSCWVDP